MEDRREAAAALFPVGMPRSYPRVDQTLVAFTSREGAASDRTRVFAGHFPFPGVGHVLAEGQGPRVEARGALAPST